MFPSVSLGEKPLCLNGNDVSIVDLVAWRFRKMRPVLRPIRFFRDRSGKQQLPNVAARSRIGNKHQIRHEALETWSPIFLGRVSPRLVFGPGIAGATKNIKMKTVVNSPESTARVVRDDAFDHA